jgi:hypothetical protein
MQCYAKDDEWAMCKVDCAPGGPDLSDSDSVPWSCEKLGERTPAMAPWVGEACSGEGESCLETHCCKNPGDACYTQNDWFATCRGDCNPEYDQGWECKMLGLTTPTSPSTGGVISPWVLDTCSKVDEGCLEPKCCLGMGMQCYKKNEDWAMCMSECAPGYHADDNNESWTCEKLGPRSWGNAIKGNPSLYCFSVIRSDGYEVDLMNEISKKNAGIFDCDAFDILTAETSVLVAGVNTVSFQGADIIGSVDGTAGNTWLFVNAWQKVVDIGKWDDHAFIAKVDADAVFLPEKLRWHLGSFVGVRMYVINCQAWNMIYGALEVFSHDAIKTWKLWGNTCNAPNDFGEDKYMTQCMDHLEVMRVDDFGVVGDKLCGSFTSCSAMSTAAFHPFKDVYSWTQCYDEARAVLDR